MAETEGKLTARQITRAYEKAGLLYGALYWVKHTTGVERAPYVEKALEALTRAADALGYKLVKKEGE